MSYSTAKIANGASQSGAIDVSSFSGLVGIAMPAAWTAAQISLLAAEKETGTFRPVFDAAGDELIIEAAAGRYIAVAPEALRFRYLKVRSGTSAAAVNQGAERVLELVFTPAGS